MTNYVTQTDDQLVRMYEEGDFQAFDVLLERNQDKVFGYIRFMVPDIELANDLFQDTFVKAIMAIRNGHYTESGQFSSWLMRIARNQVLDCMRSQRNPNRNIISHEMIDDEGDVVGDLFNNASLCEPNIESKTSTRLCSNWPLNIPQKKEAHLSLWQIMSPSAPK